MYRVARDAILGLMAYVVATEIIGAFVLGGVLGPIVEFVVPLGIGVITIVSMFGHLQKDRDR